MGLKKRGRRERGGRKQKDKRWRLVFLKKAKSHKENVLLGGITCRGCRIKGGIESKEGKKKLGIGIGRGKRDLMRGSKPRLQARQRRIYYG